MPRSPPAICLSTTCAGRSPGCGGCSSAPRPRKLGREIEQLELALEELEAERDAAPVEERPSETASRPAPLRSLPAHLPREDVVHEPASGACTCPDCGGALRRLGLDAHEMLDIVPVRWRGGAQRPPQI